MKNLAKKSGNLPARSLEGGGNTVPRFKRKFRVWTGGDDTSPTSPCWGKEEGGVRATKKVYPGSLGKGGLKPTNLGWPMGKAGEKDGKKAWPNH